MLTAITLSADSLFNQRTLSRFNLSKGGVQHARDALVHEGHLRAAGSDVELVDPLLAEWIRRLDDRSARD